MPRRKHPNYPPGSVVDRHGPLRLVGRQLTSAAGNPLQLRGLSTHGLQWFGWGDFLAPEGLDHAVQDWGIDVLRVSLYVDEGGFRTDPPRFTAMVDTLVDETAARGIYCILDWHLLDPGDPLARLADAQTFFRHVARHHGRKPHVLFEICNEPNGPGVTWNRIKTYAAEIIPLIRAHSPDNLILLGTEDWSSFGAAGDSKGHALLASPLTEPLAHHLLYTFHFYAASHKCTHREVFDRVASKLPVFVSEWGMQTYTGRGPNDLPSTRQWLKLLDHHCVSWVYWNYSNEPSSGAVFKTRLPPHGPYTHQHLKPSGRHVRRFLKEGA